MDAQNCSYGQTQYSDRTLWLKFLAFLKSMIATLQSWNELARQRRQLRDMDDHMLKDIGLSRADVSRIAGNHWFWDDPLNRKADRDQSYRSSDHFRQR